MRILGNTISLKWVIGYCQYSGGHGIGYWQYISVYRKREKSALKLVEKSSFSDFSTGRFGLEPPKDAFLSILLCILAFRHGVFTYLVRCVKTSLHESENYVFSLEIEHQNLDLQ